MKKYNADWTPTPSFLYRSYLYLKIARKLLGGKRFLDVGAGNGEFLKQLSRLGFKGESIDLSDEAVEFAKYNLRSEKDVIVKKGNIFTFKTTEKYDVVFSFETLEHIEDDELAMQKIFALLKPNGTFVMSVPAHMEEWSKIDEMKGHQRRYEHKELEDKLKNSGFVIKNFYSYGFPILWLIRGLSNSGNFLRSKTQHLGKKERSLESSIQREYNPKLKFIVENKLIMLPLFKIMDLFLNTDLGLGYIVVSKKPKS